MLVRIELPLSCNAFTHKLWQEQTLCIYPLENQTADLSGPKSRASWIIASTCGSTRDWTSNLTPVWAALNYRILLCAWMEHSHKRANWYSHSQFKYEDDFGVPSLLTQYNSVILPHYQVSKKKSLFHSGQLTTDQNVYPFSWNHTISSILNMQNSCLS